ncbi:unannotated protein [freshwater metagenome]|uniref:Unannotated protein n=1 Tax=freshwater metagenome TaxID=449393 RepID=A0A6J6VM29_9ZZZZ
MVPEPSERTTGTIRRDGMDKPGLSALIAGSFQDLITPVKILATVNPDNRKFVTRLPEIVRLYIKDVPPATIGI